VLDLPDDITQSEAGCALAGACNTRPNVPQGVVQRRISYTKNGVEGSGFGLRTTADGSLIVFSAKDGSGIVQLFGISPNGGLVKQLTHNVFSIQGPFNISPDSHWVAFPADNSIFISPLDDGKPERITSRFTDDESPMGAPVWSNDGTSIAYNRYVNDQSGRFLQIFILEKS